MIGFGALNNGSISSLLLRNDEGDCVKCATILLVVVDVGSSRPEFDRGHFECGWEEQTSACHTLLQVYLNPQLSIALWVEWHGCNVELEVGIAYSDAT